MVRNQGFVRYQQEDVEFLEDGNLRDPQDLYRLQHQVSLSCPK